jgi:hypothetical protein
VLDGLIGGRELPSNDGRRPGCHRKCVYQQIGRDVPDKKRPNGCLARRMPGSFGLPPLPVPKSILGKQSQPMLALYGGSHLLLFPIQQVVRPRTDAPQYCVGPPRRAL